MPVTEEQVLGALKQVLDPELRHNVVDLGFIQEIEILDDYVHLDIQLTTPHCPFAEDIAQSIRKAVAQLPGVARVEVARVCAQKD